MAGLKLCVLISGRGSNLQALIDACQDPDYPAEIALVLSNKESAKGLERAREAGIDTLVVDHKAYSDRESFDAAMTKAIEAKGIDLVCLAGFMRLLSDSFVHHWRDRLINIHPSLLPSFKGLEVHERVLQAGTKFSGCTVHYVRTEMDSGPIIVQAVVPVLSGDTPADLADRVLTQEHVIYPLAVRLVAEGRVTVDDQDRAVVSNPPEPKHPKAKQALINPEPVS